MSVDDTADRSSGSGLLEKVDKAYFELEKVFNYASALVILALMFLAVFQVVGRKVINLPVRGYVDWVEFAMPLFAFMGIAYCQAVGGHVRMEFIISRFKGRLLWFLETLSTLVAMLIIALLMWYGYEHFLRAELALAEWLAARGELAEALAAAGPWRRMDARLALYVAGQPCRMPWDREDPLFYPLPGSRSGVDGA